MVRGSCKISRVIHDVFVSALFMRVGESVASVWRLIYLQKYTLRSKCNIQETDGVFIAFLLSFHFSGDIYVFFFPPPHNSIHVCVCVLELISNSNDISPLQIKLFSSFNHLFLPSFVLHLAADSISPWPKTCARKSPEPRIAKSQLVCFCWELCWTTVSACDQCDLGLWTGEESKNYF